MRNDPVIQIKEKERDDLDYEEKTKYSESSIDEKNNQRRN